MVSSSPRSRASLRRIAPSTTWTTPTHRKNRKKAAGAFKELIWLPMMTRAPQGTPTPITRLSPAPITSERGVTPDAGCSDSSRGNGSPGPISVNAQKLTIKKDSSQPDEAETPSPQSEGGFAIYEGTSTMPCLFTAGAWQLFTRRYFFGGQVLYNTYS